MKTRQRSRIIDRYVRTILFNEVQNQNRNSTTQTIICWYRSNITV